MAKIKETLMLGVETTETHSSVGGNIIWYILYEWSSHSVPGFVSNRNKRLFSSKDICKNVHSNIIHDNANWNPPKCPSVGECIEVQWIWSYAAQIPLQDGICSPSFWECCWQIAFRPSAPSSVALAAPCGAAHIHTAWLRQDIVAL